MIQEISEPELEVSRLIHDRAVSGVGFRWASMQVGLGPDVGCQRRGWDVEDIHNCCR